jgi:hypothetical protein
MFLKNKYEKWYFQIVTRNKNNSGYVEKHHIIPRSLGGSNEVENIVKLTAREHFICHLLLRKMTSGNAKKKMIYAAYMMYTVKNKFHKGNRDFIDAKINSRMYQAIKEDHRNLCRKPCSEETKLKISQSKTGKKISAKHRLRLIEANTGSKRSDEVRKKLSDLAKGKPRSEHTRKLLSDLNLGKTHSEETKEKMKQAQIKRWALRKGITQPTLAGRE